MKYWLKNEKVIEIKSHASYGCDFCEVFLQKMPLNESDKNFLRGTFHKCFVLLVRYWFYCFIGVPLRKRFFQEASIRLKKLSFALRNEILPTVFLKINSRLTQTLFVNLAYCSFLCVQINYSIINRKLKNRYGKI